MGKHPQIEIAAFSIGLFFLLIFSPIASGMPVREEKVVVKVKAANIRSKPDLNSPVLITVVKGTVLEVQGRVDDYYKIIFSSEEKGRIIGYIREDLVESLGKTEIIPETKAAVLEPGKKENIFGRGSKSRLRAVGFRLGFGLANLYGENVQEFEEYLEEEMKSRIGPNFGLLAIVNLTDQLALQSECAYVSKGAKQSGEVAGEKFTASVILNYLELPALLRFYFPGGSQFTPSIYAGTYVDLKLSGKVKVQVAEVKVEEDVENLKGSDAGIIIGGGFDFQMPFLAQGKISLDLRYCLGLTSLSTDPEVETKNKVFSISLGYLF